MKRSGFKRPTFERKPVVLTPVPERLRRNATMGPAELKAIPKNPPGRNQDYRDMARDKPCMLQIPGVCCGDPKTVCLCHSNKGADGKGMGMKADDALSVWGCWKCHQFLDQGKAPAATKDWHFNRARERMRVELEKIVTDRTVSRRDLDAAAWALGRLKARAGS